MKKIFLIFTLLFSTLFANELKNSTSPYLLMHKDNPVNWMEWSDRAFKKAKNENKLIFVSIGYSTCHWCHVMNKESFSQKDVADILNRYYVSIKVDKERLTHIDNYFQNAYRLVSNKAGGWPLTVILLPDKKPIFFATYMRKDDLKKILFNIAKMDRKELEKIGDEISKAIKEAQNAKVKYVKLDKNFLQIAFEKFKLSYDFKNKGFGSAPKFPQASSIDALLNIYLITDNKEALKMATDMLDAMAKGGIYDQIDGGFFRYSVDSKWQIPHFEKMLYTNAQLISVYAKAYKITKSKLYAKVIKESIKEIDKRLLKNGLYYSAINADSKDENGQEKEGYYYIFDYDKTYDYLLKKGISKKRAQAILEHFGIEKMGNFEGGDYSNPTLKEYTGRFEREKHLLSQYRAKKEFPFIDKKINTAWNALFIKAKLDASIIDKRYEKEAIASLHKLLELMYKKNTLYHQTLLPNKPTQKGELEDYAFVADTLFSAYEKTLDDEYLKLFRDIVNLSVNKFYKNGKWLQSEDSEFKVLADISDGSYKSPLATNLENIIKNIAFNEEYKLLDIIRDEVKKSAIFINSYPNYFPTMLRVVIMKQLGIFIIKGPKLALLKDDFSDVKYPFTYKKAEQLKRKYLVCGMINCFESLPNLKEAKEKINKISANILNNADKGE